MIAACVLLRVCHGPREWYIPKLREPLRVWRRGLQAGAQSRRPRWLPQERALQEQRIVDFENNMAKTTVAAREEAERAKMEAFWAKHRGFGGMLKSATKALGAVGAMIMLPLCLNVMAYTSLAGLQMIYSK